jgi:hypothetical protein
MISVPLHPSSASGTSAANKIRACNNIRAFSRRRAGLLPFRISASGSVFHAANIRRGSTAQPHNIFFYGNFLCCHDRLRRSGRAESDSPNPFNYVEARH